MKENKEVLKQLLGLSMSWCENKCEDCVLGAGKLGLGRLYRGKKQNF